MAIKSGRFGRVSWDPAGGSALVEMAALNAWRLDQSTEMEDVSTFGSTNRAYVPGLPNTAGEFSGFWDSSDLKLWQAAASAIAGTLKLEPNRQEPGYYWQGLAYLSANIDCSLAVPTVTGTWSAAANWTLPGMVLATGATAGLPGSFTPAGATPRANLAAMTGVTASPATNWTVGQHVELGDGTDANWNGTAWVAGVHQ